MSKLLDRIKFALTYDIDREFIVFDFPEQMAMRFLRYEDAKKFADSQFQYKPEIMVGVRRKS